MIIKCKAPFSGLAPAWYKNSNSFIGNANHIGNMQNCDLSDPNCISNGPALVTAGTVTELLHHIADYTIVSGGSTLAVSNTKVWTLNGSTAADSHTISDSVGLGYGNSIIELNNYVYYIFNKTSSTTTGCDIGRYDLSSTWTDNYGSTSDSTGVRQTGNHPVAKISTTNTVIAIFGNGQYVGTITPSGVDFNVVDFGAGSAVIDVRAHSGKFWVAVNTPNITGNKGDYKIYVFDPDFTKSTDPEGFVSVSGKIGALFVDNGIMYVFHKDESSSAYNISFVNGSGLTPVGEFNGGLPNYAQVTKYKDFILFVSGAQLWCSGAAAKGLPNITFQLTTNLGATSGALATPMGSVLSSSYTSTTFYLSKFSGYQSTFYFETINFQLSDIDNKGRLNSVVVYTEPLVDSQSFDVTLKVNNSTDVSRVYTQSSLGYQRHYIPVGADNIDDVRIKITGKDANLLKVKGIDFLFNNYDVK